ncbi:hypothetical protein Z043_108766 [Scleropages formosus]|uniref:Uncharacterized protein n=1 Tax=Scleropages formosus TaxID=113540 RepID=A0A0P7VFR6_SCLFO|nr:hypothetical protein Z043_108766 [Scleropages formosus]
MSFCLNNIKAQLGANYLVFNVDKTMITFLGPELPSSIFSQLSVEALNFSSIIAAPCCLAALLVSSPPFSLCRVLLPETSPGPRNTAMLIKFFLRFIGYPLHILLVTYKGLAPPYIVDLLANYKSGCTVSSEGSNLLEILEIPMRTVGCSVFSYWTPEQWNTIAGRKTY